MERSGSMRGSRARARATHTHTHTYMRARTHTHTHSHTHVQNRLISCSDEPVTSRFVVIYCKRLHRKSDKKKEENNVALRNADDLLTLNWRSELIKGVHR